MKKHEKQYETTLHDWLTFVLGIVFCHVILAAFGMLK
jgi:hypothetical protein